MTKLIKFSIPVSILKEGDTFIAYTSTLDISTCADTLKEVKIRFEELVKIFFEDLDRNNTTEEVLDGLGWQKVNRTWQAPIEVEHQIEDFKVPVRV